MRKVIVFGLIFLWKTCLLGQYKLVLEKLPQPINSNLFDEIGPIISYDGQTLYFTRVGDPDFDKTLVVDGKNLHLTLSQFQFDNLLAKIYSQIADTKIRNAIRSEYNQDVWVAQFKENKFSSLHHPGPPLNNALPNSICALTPEENTFLVLNQFLPEGGMNQGFSIIEKKGKNWEFPRPVEIENYYTTGKNVNVTMSPDGAVLIMSLERKRGYGRNDLYVSFKDGLGGWTEPMNLGPNINSRLSEDTPTISGDKKTIYFSSNRTNTMGGRDIFRARRNSDSWTDWTRPRRFIEPINSNQDDSQPYFNDKTGYLYFTSNREGTADIYRVQVASPSKDEVFVKGKMVNAVTGEPMAAKVLYGPTTLKHYLRYFISKDGTFSFRIPKGETFKISAEEKGFLRPFKKIQTKKGKYYPTQELVLELIPIQTDVKIALAPIYFVQSKSSILEQSYPSLDYLLSILQEHSKIHIRIEGHTENRGNPKELLDLSEARAFAVKRYLMDKGIASNRMETVGLGGTKPAVFNKNEQLRQQNRRVEIHIIKTED